MAITVEKKHLGGLGSLNVDLIKVTGDGTASNTIVTYYNYAFKAMVIGDYTADPDVVSSTTSGVTTITMNNALGTTDYVNLIVFRL